MIIDREQSQLTSNHFQNMANWNSFEAIQKISFLLSIGEAILCAAHKYNLALCSFLTLTLSTQFLHRMSIHASDHQSKIGNPACLIKIYHIGE